MREPAVVSYSLESRGLGHVQWAHRPPQMHETCGQNPYELANTSQGRGKPPREEQGTPTFFWREGGRPLPTSTVT